MLYRSDVKTASNVVGYSQKFGRIARGGKDKPVLIVQDFAGNGLAKAVRYGDYVPDCNDVMAEPVYDPRTNEPALFTSDVVLPDIDDPNHPAWNGAVWDGKDFLFPDTTYVHPRGRAARHSLNDGNRDSQWAGLDRRAKRWLRNAWNNSRFAIRGYWDDFFYFIGLFMGLTALSITTLLLLGFAQ